MSYRLSQNGRQFVVIAAGGHGRLGTDIGDSVVAFALPESGAGVLAQTVGRTLRTVGVLFVLFLALVLIVRFAHRNWVWYALLVILIIIATWVAWLVSQAIPMTVLVIVAAVTIALLLTLGRTRLYARDAR